ncbi:hypothetical protein [Actinomyces gerencseriae]|uniref:hypothetical protein n=1 Tax=Actinomyces gerencseriae TaxID=52769 RepID=UPI00040E1910|nr:hypothetical protein [Actinomyces gerencseriae]
MTALLTLLLGIMAVLAPGGADRPVLRRRAAPELVTAQIVVLVVGALLGALVLGLPWWQTAAAILLAGLWSVLARLVVGPRASLGCWGAVLAVVALCAALQDEPQAAARRAADLCQGAGCLLLLTTPANRLVIDLLAVARGRTRASDAAEADGDAPLRGGRWIGPLERILLLLLASAGAHHTAIAAVIAAKGVVRFPEISRDEGGGKAEEFLIGSLASWTLAVLAAALLIR